jgi:hypothetical protein
MSGETIAPAFTAWLDDFFAAYYRRRPVNATFIGVHDHDDRLPDYSEAGIAEMLAEGEALLTRLKELPAEPLSRAQAIDRQLAEGALQIQRWELGSRHFQRGNPAEYTGEAVFGVMSLFLRRFEPALRAQRVEAAIGRLEAVPTLFEQGQANLREAPAAWTERAIRECQGALLFLQGGIDELMREEGIDDPRLRRAADRAAEATARFQRFLHDDLLRHPSETYAAGPEALDLLIHRGHFLDMDAAAIDDYASRELADRREALEREAATLGPSSPREILAGLADLHPSAEQYYPEFERVWSAAHDAALRHDLVSWPDYPIRYVPRPRWTRAAAPYLYFLFYRAPAAFDRVDVVDYLVAPLDPDWSAEETERFLRANNDSVIKLNHVVHHGGLGHHVQNWYAYNVAESRVGRIAAVDCASRIAMFCGGTMAEGWSCYTTELMGEVGFLTPLEKYAEHQSRLRMAARAIVDVRLHTGQLTLDQATAFYRDEVGMSPDASLGEAVKNSMFPGAALMYLMGTDQIHDLRRDLASRQGERFSLRGFHDRFLSHGSIPVALIAREMREAAGAE